MRNDRYVAVTGHPAGRDGRRKALSLAAVLASTVGIGIAYGIGYTITSVRFDDWGAPGWLIGAAGAAPSVALVLLISFAPRIAARLGAVPAMVAGSVLVAATFVLMPVLESPGWWLVLRVLSGAGFVLPWLVGETWINTVTSDRIRGRVLAGYTVLLFAGWAAGPLLLDGLGTTGAAPFAIGVAGMALAATPLVLARRLAPDLPAVGRFSLRGAVALAPIAMAAAAIGGVAEFGSISLLPVFAVDAGLTQSEGLRLLSVLLVGGILLQAGVGWLADAVDRRLMLAGLGLALAVVVTLLGLLVGGPGGYVGAFLLGGVVMGFYAVGLTILGERVPTGQLAPANAAFLLSYELGSVVGPLVGGAALDVWRPHGMLVLFGVAGVAFALVVLRRGVTTRRRPASRRPGPRPASRPR